MNFGEALELLKQGKKLTREGWNGKGLFIYLVPANRFNAETDAAKSIADEDGKVSYEPYFAIRTNRGTVSTWVPSISDCLAEDWKIYNIEDSTDSATYSKFNYRHFLDDLKAGKFIARKGWMRTFLSYKDDKIIAYTIEKDMNSINTVRIDTTEYNAIHNNLCSEILKNEFYILDYDKKENLTTLEAALSMYIYGNDVWRMQDYGKQPSMIDYKSISLLFSIGNVNDWCANSMDRYKDANVIISRLK